MYAARSSLSSCLLSRSSRIAGRGRSWPMSRPTTAELAVMDPSIIQTRNIQRSTYPDVKLPEKNYFDFVWSNRDKHADRIALVDGITNEKLTYAESYRHSKNFGLALQEAGAQPKDVLAMFLPNCLEYPLIFAGAASVGVTLTTINPRYTAREVQNQLELSGATWAVTDKEHWPTLREAIQGIPNRGAEWQDKVLILGDDMQGTLSAKKMMTTDIMGRSDIYVDVHNDTCVIPFSSGTTGLPKGVELTHFNMTANVCQTVDSVDELRAVQQATESFQPLTVCVLPLFHAFAMNVTMTPTLYAGGTMVMLPSFQPGTFLRALHNYKPTFFHTAPPLVSFLANSPDVEDSHLEHMTKMVVAAAPSGPALVHKFQERAPHVAYCDGWGMTETSPVCIFTPSNDIVVGSSGVPVPNTEAKIVDVETGAEKGPNELGELCIRGPQVMKGYLNNPQATSSTIQDGWLHSGDIAKYDDQGHFFITDRLKELIKVKGFQVPPAELDDLLRSHEKIHDVAVIGVPHEKLGEAPRAYIVPKAGTNLSREEIHAFVKKSAASYKQLAGGIEFSEVIPKTATGKILRKELLAKFKREAA